MSDDTHIQLFASPIMFMQQGDLPIPVSNQNLTDEEGNPITPEDGDVIGVDE